jgi:hypothetical protein
MLTAPPPPPEGFDDGAVDVVDVVVEESVDEDVSDCGGLADATHGVAAIPAPMPSATANAPTRPI